MDDRLQKLKTVFWLIWYVRAWNNEMQKSEIFPGPLICRVLFRDKITKENICKANDLAEKVKVSSVFKLMTKHSEMLHNPIHNIK